MIPLAYNVTVADVMSPSPVTIGPGASLYDALVLMRSHDITGLPVVDEAGRVLGVVSQHDLARTLSVPVNLSGVKGLLDILMVAIRDQPADLLAKLRQTLEEVSVEEAMSRPPFVVAAEAPLELAMEAMTQNALHRLPVVRSGRLVGIVTPTDLISAALRRREPRA